MNTPPILIITHDYPPVLSPRALRWSAIAEFWAAQQRSVDVIYADHGATPTDPWRNGVRVHGIGQGVFGRLRRRIAGGPGKWREPAATGDGHVARPAPPGLVRRLAGTARQWAVWSYDHTWRKLWWPDYAASWYFPAVRQARSLIRQHGCDTLITSSHPFTGHLVGLRIKREHPDLPWIVDIGDPFCFAVEAPCNNQALYRRLNALADRKVFEKADAIAVTNTVTQRIYAELFPAAAERIHVIPPLVRGESPEEGADRVFPDDDRLRLVFVGRLYSGIRSPERLLATFCRLLETPVGQKLDLHFFGWAAGCEACFEPYRDWLGKRIFLHGPVDHATARRAMAEADYLVNLGNATTYQLPSKLVEYTRTGRPILNFAGSPEDSSALFLRDYPAAISLFSQEGTNHERQWSELLEFLERPPRLDRDPLRRWTETFETESIAGRYQSLIDAARRRARPQDDAPRRPVVLAMSDYYLPGCKGGGPIRTLTSMVQCLSQRLRFRVVTGDRDLKDTEPYADCPVNAWRPMGEAEVMHVSPERRSLRALRRTLNETPHDVLYLNSFLSPSFTIYPLALRRLGLVARRPVVLAPRGELAAGALRLSAAKKRAYLLAAKMLGLYRDVIWQAASPSERRDIRAWFPRARVYVAPDMCVAPTAEPIASARRKQPGTLRIVFLSRIMPNKNLHGALRLLQTLRGTVEFHIYGPQENEAYWKECRRLVEQLPPGVTAVAHGPVTHAQVFEVLRQHHVFLLPTHGESFGHAILEALLAGCPVLLSDQTPWRNLQEKGIGWDLPLSQPSQFQRALQQCIDMDDEAYQAMSHRAEQYGMSAANDGQVLQQNLHVFWAATRRGRAAA